MPTRNCTKTELNINNETVSNSKFYEPHETSVSDLEFFFKKLKCLDVDHVEVQGDYNSPNARSFVILFVKCDKNSYKGPGKCKFDAQIKAWLARKFILVVMNNERFNTREYDTDKKVKKESRTNWIPINS